MDALMGGFARKLQSAKPKDSPSRSKRYFFKNSEHPQGSRDGKINEI